jgi:hypothetical protein
MSRYARGQSAAAVWNASANAARSPRPMVLERPMVLDRYWAAPFFESAGFGAHLQDLRHF